MPLITRSSKGDRLTIEEMDNNLLYLESISGGISEISKSSIDSLISDNSLETGRFYSITNADTNLFGGSTVIIHAVSNNRLSSKGVGFFYNPKYNQSLPGFGIWTKNMSGIFSNVSGIFQNNELVVSNNSAIARFVANGLLQWLSGDWSGATSITGGSSNATANVNGFTSPSYEINNTVIWGGRHWTNLNGNVGSNVDKYTLDGEWEVISYNTTDYNLVVDTIEYDYSHDYITYRKDNANNVISVNYIELSETLSGNSIKDFQWGNISGDYTIGVSENQVIGGYFECINFRGSYINGNNIYKSEVYNNIFEGDSTFSNNKCNYSNITSNIFSVGRIYNNFLSNSSFTSNVLSNSEIYNNIFDVTSSLSSNKLIGSRIYYNSISHSNVDSNTISGGSDIFDNTLSHNSSIDNNVLSDSNVNGNLLLSSYFSHTHLYNSTLSLNDLSNSAFNFTTSGTVSNSTLSQINAKDSDVSDNISSSTIIYGDYSKSIIKTSGGDSKILHWIDGFGYTASVITN